MTRKSALITGSATGVGRATALRFAKLGFAVAVNYSRSKQEAEETLAEVRKFDVPAILCQANVAEKAAVQGMIERCVQEWGGLDVLVNNAGTTHFIDYQDLDALTDEVWQEILGVNLLGTFSCCRAAWPYLRQRRGAIVNVTSVAGLSGSGSSIPYAVSKGAVNTLTKSLARTMGPEVRVNAVAPGPILTRWLEGHMERVEQYVSQAPLGRAASADDIAETIEYLAVGARLMTGQVVVVDGGRTM